MKYPTLIEWSNIDQKYIASVLDLPGCMVDGSTESEAVKAARIAAQKWVEIAIKLGRSIPTPGEWPDSAT